ncbi:putative Centrosomal protein POC5 [Trypanosoma cruzi]|nr:putative Centrosomal protein POC5 [Trypanosoma cruzi]
MTGVGGGGVPFGDFLREVGHGIDTHTSRMREDILLLLSPYIGEQLRLMRESLRAEAERREQVLMDEKREIEASLIVAEENIQKQKKLVQALALTLGDAHKRLWWRRRFRDWLEWILKKRQQRQLCRTMIQTGNMMRKHHFYAQWRLFAASRRQRKHALAEESRWSRREAELLAEAEALKGIVEEERRRSDGLEEKMKAAFVRGVCALNKEAVQVLRGAQTVEEEVGESKGVPPRLYDARTVRLPSTRTSHTPSTTARFEGLPIQKTTTATTAPAATATITPIGPVCSQEGYSYQYTGVPQQASSQATCPLHHVCPPGPPCHVCYAPDTCAYNVRSSPHQPFVVSVDPSAVRSYGDTPASQRPPHVARRPVRTERPRVSR